jgi:hypothetical protein
MSDEKYKAEAWRLALACRAALDHEVYGGRAPSDSNALTEVWPTAAGAAFVIDTDAGKIAVILAPEDAVSDQARLPVRMRAD